jgi:hypothetical protein
MEKEEITTQKAKTNLSQKIKKIKQNIPFSRKKNGKQVVFTEYEVDEILEKTEKEPIQKTDNKK